MKTYYSNINKKKLCNRNNGELKTLPRFDFQMQDYFSVTFIDSLNKIIDIDPTDQFYIAGGLDVMKDSENLLFYSEDFTLENNKLTFTIDTYTDNYLKHIKNTNTPIYLEIGIINEKKTILLQDTVLAEPRVYLDGIVPTNIEVYYTKAQVDKKLAEIKVEQTDPIYTADKPNLALKSEIPSSLSELMDDVGYITSSEIPTIPSSLSELNNDAGYITGYIETDPIYTADKPNLALKSELPTKLSDLQNDEGFITGYTETDPIYTADKAKLALKTEIPSSLSELENDAGYITSAAVKSTIGISEDGSETKYLNEKGQFVQVESGGGHTKWGVWEDRTLTTKYTADVDGWLLVKGTTIAADAAELYIDDIIVWRFFTGTGLAGFEGTALIPVFAGQTYKAGIYCDTIQFAPCV